MAWAEYQSAWRFYKQFLGRRVYVLFVLKMISALLDLLGLSLFIPVLGLLAAGGNSVRLSEIKGFERVLSWLHLGDVSLRLMDVMGLMMAVFLMKAVFNWISFRTQARYKIRFRNRVRFTLLNHLFEMSYRQYMRLDHGRVLSNLTSEMSTAIQLGISQVDLRVRLVWLMVYLGVLFVLSPYFLMFLAAGGILYGVLVFPFISRVRALAKRRIRMRKLLQKQILQATTHFKYLKITDTISLYFQNLEKMGRRLEQRSLESSKIQGLVRTISEPLRVVILALILLISVYLLEMDIKVVLVGVVLLGRVLQMMFGLYQSRLSFVSNYPSLERLERFQAQLIRKKESFGTERKSPFHGPIELHGVSFEYANDAPLALDRLDLTIHPKQTVALVGSSGSGKSTSALLISGLMAPTQGEIKLDGLPWADYDYRSVRARIGFVAQESMIFDDDIYQNITLWQGTTPETDERFQAVVQRVGLKELLQQLPEGARTQLGKHGERMSGGQRQRVAIARELYKEVELLIFDEPTSALDSQAEREMIEQMNGLRGEVTMIWISHRLHTVRFADQIMVLDNGKVVQSGTFEQLESADGWFAENLAVQTDLFS